MNWSITIINTTNSQPYPTNIATTSLPSQSLGRYMCAESPCLVAFFLIIVMPLILNSIVWLIHITDIGCVVITYKPICGGSLKILYLQWKLRLTSATFTSNLYLFGLKCGYLFNIDNNSNCFLFFNIETIGVLSEQFPIKIVYVRISLQHNITYCFRHQLTRRGKH